MNEHDHILHNHGYKVIEKIGSGASADCYLVLSLKYNANFVIKVMTIDSERQSSLKKNYESEIGVLAQTIHPNIIQIYDNFIEGNYLFLILEYCSLRNIFASHRRRRTRPGRILPPAVHHSANALISSLPVAPFFTALKNRSPVLVIQALPQLYVKDISASN